MKNLYKYELNIDTGCLWFDVIENVVITKNSKIVRSKFKEYDLKHGAYVLESDLNKYSRARANNIISYYSLKDDVNIEIMKGMAIGIINDDMRLLMQGIINKKNLIKEIENIKVGDG